MNRSPRLKRVRLRERQEKTMWRSRNLLRRLLAGIAVSLALGGNAAAQSADPVPVVTPPFELPFLPSPSGLWTVTIGGQVEAKPGFVGAKTDNLGAAPIFNIHRAGSASQFRSPVDS